MSDSGQSLPCSSVHGILQARVLEWGAISFSRGSSRPRDRTQVSALQTDSLPSEPLRKPECGKHRLKKRKTPSCWKGEKCRPSGKEGADSDKRMSSWSVHSWA